VEGANSSQIQMCNNPALGRKEEDYPAGPEYDLRNEYESTEEADGVGTLAEV